jgi:hypothetical protein
MFPPDSRLWPLLPPSLPPRRHFEKLPPRTRTRLLEALCGNVPFLASSISKLGPTERSHPSTPTLLLQHRNALQQYAFFLTWLSSAADQCAAVKDRDGAAATGDRGALDPIDPLDPCVGTGH